MTGFLLGCVVGTRDRLNIGSTVVGISVMIREIVGSTSNDGSRVRSNVVGTLVAGPIF